MIQYQVIFGENPDHKEITRLQKTFYVLFSIIVNIVNMNLMITIICYYLDDLQIKTQSQDLRIQFQEVLSMNCVLNSIYAFLRCCCRKKIDYDKHPKYLHFLSNDIQDIDDRE